MCSCYSFLIEMWCSVVHISWVSIININLYIKHAAVTRGKFGGVKVRHLTSKNTVPTAKHTGGLGASRVLLLHCTKRREQWRRKTTLKFLSTAWKPLTRQLKLGQYRVSAQIGQWSQTHIDLIKVRCARKPLNMFKEILWNPTLLWPFKTSVLSENCRHQLLTGKRCRIKQIKEDLSPFKSLNPTMLKKCNAKSSISEVLNVANTRPKAKKRLQLNTMGINLTSWWSLWWCFCFIISCSHQSLFKRILKHPLPVVILF